MDVMRPLAAVHCNGGRGLDAATSRVTFPWRFGDVLCGAERELRRLAVSRGIPGTRCGSSNVQHGQPHGTPDRGIRPVARTESTNAGMKAGALDDVAGHKDQGS